MKRLLLFVAPILCALAVPLASLAAAEPADTVRPLWVRRATLESEEAIRRFVTSASNAGFNTLFVQALDDSASSPQFDPIAETITQAHTVGMRVHAWIDVARVTSPGELPFARTHVVYQHPEWLMVPRAIAAELLAIDVHSPDYLGRLARWTRANVDHADGLYVSPAQSDAATYVAEVVRGVAARYPFDGVYFDHVQYPATDFDYSAKSIATFRDAMRTQLTLGERQRIDVMEAIDPFAYPNELNDQWRLFRQSQLTALVARLRSAVKAVRPEAIVSAAVTWDPAIAERDHLQDWRTWVDNGFLDALCPIVAAGDAAKIEAQLAEIAPFAGGRPVWVPVTTTNGGFSRFANRIP
jgi:uncharacterized lipoprotein YddW (UPF0748 family)